MKIVFVENIDPHFAPVGGIGTYLSHIVPFLKSKGIHTTLIGAGAPVKPGESSKLAIPVDSFIPITPKKKSHPAFTFKLLFKVGKILRNLEPEAVIHGQRPDVLFPFVLFSKNRKLVCSLHAMHDKAVRLKRGPFQQWIYEFLERFTLCRLQKIIAVGHTVEEYFVRKYPFCHERLVTIPLGVDMEKFKPLDRIETRKKYGFEADDQILLYVGRLEKEKNLDLLVDAFNRIKQSVPNAKLILVGSGREEHYLRNLVGDYKLKGVVFWGTADHEDIPGLMNCADVFTFSSLYEGGPLVVKEALACNVPVVSTDVGDIRLILPKLEGCFISQIEARDFARGILAALNMESRPDYRSRVMKHGSEYAFHETFKLYQSLGEK